MRTGGIVKQIYVVKIHDENDFKKIYGNIFHENKSKFQIFFFGDVFSLS